MSQPKRIARPTLIAGFLVSNLLLAATGYWIGASSTSDQETALATAQTDLKVYAEAQEKTLGQQAIFNGTINKPQSQAYNYQGTGTITTINIAPGQSVTPGTLIATIDSNPVIAALGSSKPIYRDIHPGDSGYDVEAIQEILNSLGYRLPVTGKFDEATENVAKRFFATIGFTSPCGEKICFQAGTFLIIPSGNLTVASTAPVGRNTAEDPQLFSSQDGNKTAVSRISVAQLPLVKDKPTITLEGPQGIILETSDYSLSDFKESQGNELPGYDLTISLPEDSPNLPDDKTPVRLSLQAQSSQYLAVPATAIRQEGAQTYLILEDGSRLNVTVETIEQGWAGLAPGTDLPVGTKVLVS